MLHELPVYSYFRFVTRADSFLLSNHSAHCLIYKNLPLDFVPRNLYPVHTLIRYRVETFVRFDTKYAEITEMQDILWHIIGISQVAESKNALCMALFSAERWEFTSIVSWSRSGFPCFFMLSNSCCESDVRSRVTIHFRFQVLRYSLHSIICKWRAIHLWCLITAFVNLHVQFYLSFVITLAVQLMIGSMVNASGLFIHKS